MPARSPTSKAASVKTKAKKSAKAKTAKILGRVVHFYDRISVAIVELRAPLRLNDMVLLKKGDQESKQAVTSLQIDHQPVEKAKKGDIVGMKVGSKTPEGTLVLPA